MTLFSLLLETYLKLILNPNHLPDKSSDDSLSLGLLDSVPGGGLQLPDQGGQETVQHLG